MKKSDIQLFIASLIAISFLFVAQTTSAQSANQKIIYKAYINSDMTSWANTIHSIETNTPPASIDQKLELINFYYGYVGYLIGQKKNGLAKKEISAAQKIINDVLKNSPNNATAMAFKGSFKGFEMSINKLKSISLGSESLSCISKAYNTDPRNVQAVTDKANALFQAPALFGGDKNEAIKVYLKAINLIESSKSADQNWLYLHILITLGKIYEKQNNLSAAKMIYEKALHKEPAFRLVKENLYPALLSKIKK
ncbi:hypothetical protein Palpr_0064 [Paludibacter propionicigenes WB4]|uniref:Uncharacterized protein n=1 Tax=Paludibacter propionicigenes (strain DSM 17365 / JCM 13257 / WB4) TaxID=694427 RepID=E4T0V1_PALPW|nr:tetratricopeptide repeat protein [Paludibacter propionicigenes]ADQ78226.1 hypothetical protein Palpr_0064 [Paludibacter propionicigenes WB4]